MKSRVILATLIVTLYACSSEHVDPNPTYLLEVDGQMYEATTLWSGGNESCGTLYLDIDYFLQDMHYEMRFEISKKGHLFRAYSIVRHIPLKQRVIPRYYTPNYNAPSTFELSGFSFDELTGHVEFKYNGTVFFEDDNSQTLGFAGYVNTELNMDHPCTFGRSGLEYESEEIDLFSLTLSRDKWSTGHQGHYFFSYNGYRIYLYTSGDFWNYPLGEEMEFQPNDYTIDGVGVEFGELVGPMMADQISTVSDFEWKDYETSGTIVLENKYIENGDRMISGKMYLTIRDQGKQLYYLDGVSFRTGSYEN
jgi:hypothetical protein